MADVAHRGSRGGRGGRGRGRSGGAPSTVNGTHKLNGHGHAHAHAHSANGTSSAGRTPAAAAENEPEELQRLRKKYAASLGLVKEMFADWQDDDLLTALNEAGGDVQLTATRIAEGHTAQWGAVKTKKEKKASSGAAVSSTFSTDRPTRGGFEGRGRGRGDGTRGGRGTGRGAVPRGRGGRSVNGVLASSFATPSDSTPSAWGNGLSISTAATQDTSGWDTWDAPVSASASGWGEDVHNAERPKPDAAPEAPAMSDGGGWSEEPAKPVVPCDSAKSDKKSTSKVIQPGAKMSWAQIARPPAPKVAPPPPARVAPATPTPVAAAPSTESELVPAMEEPTLEPATPEPVPEPLEVQEPEQPVVLVPEPNADVWGATPAAADATPSVWNEDSPAAPPAGVGEGWAETVLAQPAVAEPPADVPKGSSIFDNGGTPTPSDAANVEPLEVSTPVSEDARQIIAEAVPAAVAQETQAPAAPTSAVPVGLAPPGLTAKRASSRVKSQDAAVVMPGSGAATPASEPRPGLQFGSLSLFDHGPSEGPAFEDAPEEKSKVEEAAATPAPPESEAELVEPAEEPERYSPPTPASAPAPVPPVVPAAPASPAVPVPQPPVEEKPSFGQPSAVPSYNAPIQQAYAAPQPPQSSYGQQPQAQQSQPSAFASRYPSTQYSAPEPAQAPQPTPTHQSQQPSHQAHDAFGQSPYGRFAQHDPMAAYPSHTASPAAVPAASHQQPQHASYSGFNPMPQPPTHQSQPPLQQPQVPQQSVHAPHTGVTSGFGQPVAQSSQDYSSLYGQQDALRTLGLNYYDSYSHAQAAQAAAFQNQSRGTQSAVEEKAGTGQQPTQQSQQPQAGAPQVQHPPSQQQQHYPPSLPYYYPYYNQYGQIPPYGQNPSYPYGMQAPSPYAYSTGGYPTHQPQASYGQQPQVQPGQQLPTGQARQGGGPNPQQIPGQPQPTAPTSALGGAAAYRGQGQVPSQGQQHGLGAAAVSGAGLHQHQGHHHHHHHQASHHQQQQHQYSGYAGYGGGYSNDRGQGLQPAGGDRKDPFAFSSDRFFGQ